MDLCDLCTLLWDCEVEVCPGLAAMSQGKTPTWRSSSSLSEQNQRSDVIYSCALSSGTAVPQQFHTHLSLKCLNTILGWTKPCLHTTLDHTSTVCRIPATTWFFLAFWVSWPMPRSTLTMAIQSARTGWWSFLNRHKQRKVQASKIFGLQISDNTSHRNPALTLKKKRTSLHPPQRQRQDHAGSQSKDLTMPTNHKHYCT